MTDPSVWWIWILVILLIAIALLKVKDVRMHRKKGGDSGGKIPLPGKTTWAFITTTVALIILFIFAWWSGIFSGGSSPSSSSDTHSEERQPTYTQQSRGVWEKTRIVSPQGQWSQRIDVPPGYEFEFESEVKVIHIEGIFDGEQKFFISTPDEYVDFGSYRTASLWFKGVSEDLKMVFLRKKKQ